MVLVTERHWLRRRLLDPRPIIRAPERIKRPADAGEKQRTADDRRIGDRICPAFKKLGHTAFCTFGGFSQPAISPTALTARVAQKSSPPSVQMWITLNFAMRGFATQF